MKKIIRPQLRNSLKGSQSQTLIFFCRKFKDVETIKTVHFAQRLWVSTSSKWTNNAEESLKNQSPQVSRINVHDLANAPVEWEKLENNITGEQARTKKYPLKKHQKDALEKTHEYFQENERGNELR